jgi:hypothetical protein
MLKQCAANRKRRPLALPNVGPYIYTMLKFLALQGAQYIYDISRLRVKLQPPVQCVPVTDFDDINQFNITKYLVSYIPP